MVREMGAQVIASSGETVPQYSFVIGRHGLHDDPRLFAAAGDFVSRLLRTQDWVQTHQERVQEIWETVDKVDPADSAAIAQQSVTESARLDAKLIGDTQAMADVFYEEDVVPTKVDVSILFDPTLPVVYPPGTP